MHSVAKGVSTVHETFFRDDNNIPLVATAAPSWKLKDFNNVTILTGTPIQDMGNLSRWYANITIPSGAPVSDNGQEYTLSWTMPTASGKVTNNDSFEVVTEYSADPIDDTVIMSYDDTFEDDLVTDAPVSQYQISVRTIQDVELYNSGVVSGPSPTRRNSQYIYHYEYNTPIPNLTVTGSGVNPYVVIWKYTMGGQKYTTMHPLYVVSTRVFAMLSDLDARLNKGRYSDILPRLRITTPQMLKYLGMGLKRFNSRGNTLTGYTLQNLPESVEDLVLRAAAVEALQALFLEEGWAAFDFQGQAVQLNVDRTQYIQGLLDQLNSNLDDLIKQAKIVLMRSGTIAHVGIVVGNSTNYPGLLPNASIPFDRMRAFGLF